MKDKSVFERNIFFAIMNNENHLKELYEKSIKPMDDKGYLINLDDFEKIKEKINYYENIEVYKKSKEMNNFKSNSSLSEKFKNIRIQQIKYKTYQYLKNMLLNGNKYIFINSELWNLISNEKKEIPILFTINRSKITLSLDNNDKLTLTHINGVLDNKSCQQNEDCFEEVKKIYNSINKIVKKFFVKI